MDNPQSPAPVRLPEKKTAEPTRDDMIVINQATLYHVIIGAVFFVAGFVVAWVTFATTIGSTINTIREDTKQAAQDAVQLGLAGLKGSQAVAVQPTATPVPKQTIDLGDSPFWGAADAKVTVVEFSDFQCPYCGDFFTRTYPLLKKNYGDKVRFVFKHFPLTDIHPYAMGASLAAECAREQNKFWEYHDQLFANQADLSRDALIKYATVAGVSDSTKFSQCLDTQKYQSRVVADMNAGQNYSVGGTPTFFINGAFFDGDRPYQQFVNAIEKALTEAKS